MVRKSSSKISADYRKDIPEYSDEKIIEILKNRDHYIPEAAKLAIEEAIKREIIFSEQDLFADEYKVKEVEFSLFPTIRRTENRKKIRKSLARSLVISGIMPLVYGLVQINRDMAIEGGAIALLGLLWIYCSAQLIKQYHKTFVHLLFLISIMAAVYVYSQLILVKGRVFFDYFLPAVLFFLLMYGLFFLKRLHD